MDNLPTNQLAVSEVADWSTRGLGNSQTAIFINHRKIVIYCTLSKILTLTLTLSTTESVQYKSLLRLFTANFKPNVSVS